MSGKHAVHFSSATDQWGTPTWLFTLLDDAFKFELDVCATEADAKCATYFTPEQDGLKQVWRGRCWMNPPYGRTIGDWVKKASEAAQAGALVVALLPARTDTKWWHQYVLPFAYIEFLPGRLKFGQAVNSAPFPSAIAYYTPRIINSCAGATLLREAALIDSGALLEELGI